MNLEASSNEAMTHLDDKLNLFIKYKDTTLEMKNSLENEDNAAIIGCIKERQNIIKGIDKIDMILKNIFPSKKSQSKAVVFESKIIAAKLNNIENTMHAISEIEKICINLTESGRDRIKSEIFDLKKKKQGTGEYMASVSVPARFVDTVK